MLAEDAKGAIECLEQAPPDFADAFASAVAAAQGRSIIDPSAKSEVTWQSYATAAQVGAALFASANSSNDTIQAAIAGSPRNIASTGPQPYADAATWADAFWLAVICRDRDMANMLADIPISLLRASGAACDRYIYDWVEALQTYWHGDPDQTLGDKLATAVEGCAPSALRITEAEQALKIVHPPMNLFYRLILMDQEGFTTTLGEALELHKSFYTKTEEPAGEIQGLVPLQILAITCLGYEVGLSIETESNYIPLHLVQGAWLNNLPV
jgi:hypothetical protein